MSDKASAVRVASCSSSLREFLPYLAKNVPVIVRGVTQSWNICTIATDNRGSLLSESDFWSLFSKNEQVLALISTVHVYASAHNIKDTQCEIC